jgi:ABC-2 type transport system ATP-binding protein
MDSAAPASELIIHCRELHKSFPNGRGGTTVALAGVSLEVRRGLMVALVGPDGAGKTTLIRLIMGLLPTDSGDIAVLGNNIVQHPFAVESDVSYMPQKFGLYEDLTVQENLDLYADLHGVSALDRQERYPELFAMTNLGRFTRRLAGRLSGGMKQKLGLACALVQSPQLLILDEPTVGVDPVSRRELWAILLNLVKTRSLTLLISTPYLEEAEFCNQAMVMYQGTILTEGSPQNVADYARGRTFHIAAPPDIKPRQLVAKLLTSSLVADAVPEGGNVRLVLKADASGIAEIPAAVNGFVIEPHLADGFMVLLRQAVAKTQTEAVTATVGGVSGRSKVESGGIPAVQASSTSGEGILRPSTVAAIHSDNPVVQVHDLVRKFGEFIAVNHVNFEIRKGEIFGLLGPNGAGKSTTFRMLCGLLPLTSGTLRVAGYDLRHSRASARQAVGYVAQKFSLYSQLSVQENLAFFASAYGLRGGRRKQRMQWAIAEFDLANLLSKITGGIPDGYKRRLAMACALLHEPAILFLDEPTSGVDPLARREFWQRITAMADQGVTVVVTTHFMEEAEYCDRMVIMMNGRVLAGGTPTQIRKLSANPEKHDGTIEDAFIQVVLEEQKAALKASAVA